MGENHVSDMAVCLGDRRGCLFNAVSILSSFGFLTVVTKCLDPFPRQDYTLLAA